MSNDDDAYKLYERASTIQFSEPREALDILWETVKLFPDTLTVSNYVLDCIIEIAKINGFWDEAIDACSIAKKIKPEYQESYKLESEACLLDKAHKHIMALEVRFQKDTMHGKWYGTFRDYGDHFASLGANDFAWKLYNEATSLAVKEGVSPHTVRQSMADLLLNENKPNLAVEMLIIGISEAEKFNKKGIPKSLVIALKKTLKNIGINDPKFADEIASLCKIKSQDQVINIFRDRFLN